MGNLWHSRPSRALLKDRAQPAINRLRQDPHSLDADDIRMFSEMLDPSDAKSALIIATLEEMVAAGPTAPASRTTPSSTAATATATPASPLQAVIAKLRHAPLSIDAGDVRVVEGSLDAGDPDAEYIVAGVREMAARARKRMGEGEKGE